MMRVSLSAAALLALNIALAGGITMRLVAGSHVEAMLAATHARRPLTSLNLAPPLSSDFSAVQAQAVFHRSRSFYVAPAAPAVEQPPPDYRFAGSMSIPSQGPTAILIHNQTNTSRKVSRGDVLDGWTVADIGPRKVVVTLGERSTEIPAAASAGTGLIVVSSPAAGSTPSPGGIRVLGTSHSEPRTSQIVIPPEERVYRPPSN